MRAEKRMLSRIIKDAAQRVKFIPLSEIPKPQLVLTGRESEDIQETKMLLHRLDTLWVILNPPDALKLEFKFIIKVYSGYSYVLYAPL